MKELWLTMMWIVIVLLLYVHFLVVKLEILLKMNLNTLKSYLTNETCSKHKNMHFYQFCKYFLKWPLDPIVSTAFSFYMINFSLFPFKTKEEQID